MKRIHSVAAGLIGLALLGASLPAQAGPAEANLKAAKTFLAANATKPGIITTRSGLQYRILAPGKGRKPSVLDQVVVHYRGRLINGKLFESSYEGGQPARFPLGGVIPGWTEGLQLIGEGGKIRLFIPPDLGYGVDPPPGAPMGPNALLIFDVELLKVNRAR